MNEKKRKYRNLIFVCTAFALIVGFFAVNLMRSEALPQGPVDAVRDKEACADCRMHLGELGFAAQLQTKEGDVLFFDDSGCQFEYEAKNKPNLHAVYFHHSTEARWIPAVSVAFVAVERSPMGFNIAAVDAGTIGAMTLDAAKKKVLGGGATQEDAHAR